MAERRHVKPTRHLKLFVNAYIHNIFFKLEIKPKGKWDYTLAVIV